MVLSFEVEMNTRILNPLRLNDKITTDVNSTINGRDRYDGRVDCWSCSLPKSSAPIIS